MREIIEFNEVPPATVRGVRMELYAGAVGIRFARIAEPGNEMEVCLNYEEAVAVLEWLARATEKA